MAKTLGDLAESRSNNFRLIRLVAATSVIVSHAYVVNMGLSHATWLKEPLYAWTGVSLGELAVNIFFVTSGFLVSRSLLDGGRVLDFVMARVLRIYPGLIVSVIACTFVLGPIATNLSVLHYLSTKATWAFVFYDASALDPLRMRFELPGIFSHNPYPNIVNASLWTLPWELWMYISLIVASSLRVTGRIFPVFLIVVASLYLVSQFGLWSSYPAFPVVARFLAFFYAGVAMRRYRNAITISGKVAIISTMLFIGTSMVVQNAVFEPLYISYMTLFIAYWPLGVIKKWSDGLDISYGIYIYAYLVQQIWVWLLGSHSVILNFALTLPVTVGLAFASWFVIEKPALDLKANIRKMLRSPRALPTEI